MTSRSTLTAEDWIKAAFRALSAGGPAAVKAEAIARDLDVSKGSFYWHFKDVAALKSEMLHHWIQRGTSEIIDAVEATGASPAERLRSLVREATGGRGSDYGGEAVEAAIREWARYDAAAAAALRSVDERRLAYVAELFAAHGVPVNRAGRDARLLYAALVGLGSLAGEGAVDPRGDMLDLLGRLLGDGKP
ncbi:MAG: TetR/AcrR family transcriptional regulator [Phyllobacteriaceae bacterium]|nr:TetR/AcrR family transcriptional regulator [Phyllobacteriaceae bacterium]